MDYRVGSIIEYMCYGDLRRVKVINKEPDIKRGRPGFDGDIVFTNKMVWGYDDQITRVVTY